MQKLLIPKPQSGGLILSYQCSGECKHCMYFCSPKWNNHWISEKDLENCLNKLSGFIAPSPYGPENVSLNYGLHITGGEPFLQYNLLLRSIQIANELQIPSLFIETNGYWCKNDDLTRNKMNELKNNGLKGILISVNPFILEYVPFERSERAIRIGKGIFGKNVMIYQMYYYHQFKNLGIKEKLPVDQYLKQIDIRDLQKKVELFKMGRTVYKLQHLYRKYPTRYFFDENCDLELVRSWHNHFDNYGNYMPGYCGGLSWGKIRNLDLLCNEGIDLEEFPILKSLILGNLRELHNFADEQFDYQDLTEGYISKCHLCLDIRRKIALKSNKMKELQPQEFYYQI